MEPTFFQYGGWNIANSRTGPNLILHRMSEKCRLATEARAFAKANSIALIDGPKLTQMIASVQQNGNMQVQQEVARACPKCGSEMVQRVAKKGPHPGKEFWDCSKFPDCRGVVSPGG
jgi:ssDNA-binding Zn-finger/Zn-ribbon topoisomerase 1